MLYKFHWIVSYTVHVTAFCLGAIFSGHGVDTFTHNTVSNNGIRWTK